MQRFSPITLIIALVLALSACGGGLSDFEETRIAELHDRMQRGEIDSEQLVGWYLHRIEALDQNGPALKSIIEINPDALQIAQALDREWQSAGPRSALHGIPVVIKANIGTADRMHTSAGSLAPVEHTRRSD